MNIRPLIALISVALAVCTLVGCGGSAPATVGVIPTYAGASELKPGESPVADTLVKNMEQNQALTGSLGVNAKVEQKAFTLPQDASWDVVQKFYDEKLSGSGWSSNSMVSSALAQSNQGNDQFQIANWQKGKQNLSLILIADPSNAGTKLLIMSLTTT